MGKGFDPVKHRQWRDVLRRQKQSGLSIRGFCQRESLSEARFHWWRRELARRSAAGTVGNPRPAMRTTRRHDSPARFLPITVTPSSVTPGSAAPAYEVVLPGGARVLVHASAGEKLADVLAALEGQPC